DRFHFRVGTAVLAHEFEVHQEAWALFAGDRERRNALREAYVEDLERRADRERVFVDQLLEQTAASLGVHAYNPAGSQSSRPRVRLASVQSTGRSGSNSCAVHRPSSNACSSTSRSGPPCTARRGAFASSRRQMSRRSGSANSSRRSSALPKPLLRRSLSMV